MRLLIIGSLDGQIGTASKIAMSRGAKVAHVPDIDAALTALRAGQGADLVMMDVRHSVGDFVRSLVTERISIPVVACGIGTDAETAVRAIKDGAKEYIPLPPDPELIAAVLEAVTEESKALIYQDPIMDQVIALGERVATSDASILITGESGTGKEVLARHVHNKSNRANKQFISINCAAIPENLLESELFGHEKGAFTGAVARRIGKFEEADGGTLLLDEISEMDPRLQASCCGSCRSEKSTAPVAPNRSKSTSAYSPRATAILKQRSQRARFGKTCSSASTSSASSSLPCASAPATSPRCANTSYRNIRLPTEYR